MLRNVLAYEIYRQMGRWAPRTRFVEVLFNGGGGSEVDGADYHGVYVLMEKIKRGRDRVDINGIVKGAIERVEPLIKRREQELTVSLAGDPLWLYADSGRLEQVIGNLLNTLNAAPPPSNACTTCSWLGNLPW
jgi:hypothetical protein